MSLPCPSCSAWIAWGATRCGACHTSLLNPLTPGSNEAACAVHPELRSIATCARCGAFACAQCLREGDGGQPWCAACAQRIPLGELPWDRRGEVGLVRAFFQTAWAAISAPKVTFEGARSEGSIGSSLFFAIIASYFGWAPTFLAYAVLFVPMGLLTENRSTPSLSPAILVGIFVGYALFAPLFSAAFTFATAGIDHLVLRLFGEPQPFEVTYRAHVFAMGPMVFGLVPVCSLYVIPLWVLAVRVFAYQGLHRITAGRAALGAFAAPAVCCIGGGLSYAALFAFAMAFVKPGG